MNVYNILQHLHSINRWLVLIFLVWAIVSAVQARKGGGATHLPKGALPAFITTHIQLLLGLILYGAALADLPNVGSPYVVMDKEAWADPLYKFYSVTHFSWMLPAIVIVTVGYIVAKRRLTDQSAANWILSSYALGLLLILIGIPWPWRAIGGGWF